MKLAVIFNSWCGVELLRGSINCLKVHTDLIIIVYQDVSNRGEVWSPLPEIEALIADNEPILVKYTPDLNIPAQQNEVRKRNLGLDFAKANHCTHFLSIDNDEFYEDFGAHKELFLRSGHRGSFCKLQTYFKAPTLRFSEPEGYYVPFIHELREDTRLGNQSYKVLVDPTRTVNEEDIIELPIFMHHFSWVRKDIMRKVRNSSAPIQNNKIALEDYEKAEEGYFLRNWQRTLISVPDIFNLLPTFNENIK